MTDYLFSAISPPPLSDADTKWVINLARNAYYKSRAQFHDADGDNCSAPESTCSTCADAASAIRSENSGRPSKSNQAPKAVAQFSTVTGLFATWQVIIAFIAKVAAAVVSKKWCNSSSLIISKLLVWKATHKTESDGRGKS